ncbi:hypothetical protein GGR56DRAFT_615993 [Xylariaceae sp. FL0804]|nr:hypothetical protein GGR56DRAFT_615993 [Xylariaceae sp. FL0804]
MRWNRSLALGLTYWLPAATAATSTTSSTSSAVSVSPAVLAAAASAAAAAGINVTGVPVCGLECILAEAANSTCSALDAPCVCRNAPLLASITECVSVSCSIRDSLSTERFSNDFCGNPGEDRTALVWITAVVFGALGLLAFSLRCLARVVGSRRWGMDDTVMCLVILLMIPLAAISIPLAQHGLGLDMWNVSFDNITEILHLYYFDELLYITALALTKVSILLFYLKVFPKKSFRITTYCLIAANVTYALTYDLLLIFQCNPIQGAWLLWDGTFQGQCISINILGWSAAAFNIALDLAVIILPLPMLFSLSMSMTKRLQIVAMFAVGFFITVVSTVRLHSLIEFGTTTNLTQDYVEVGYWSTIEVPVGVICACMPAIRSLFSLAFPKVFGTTRQGTTGYGGSSFGRSLVAGGSTFGLGGAGRKGINVKQEWTVLVDPVDGDAGSNNNNSNNANDSKRSPHHEVTTSDVELVRVPTAAREPSSPQTSDVRMTIGKGDHGWQGQITHDYRNYPAKF